MDTSQARVDERPPPVASSAPPMTPQTPPLPAVVPYAGEQVEVLVIGWVERDPASAALSGLDPAERAAELRATPVVPVVLRPGKLGRPLVLDADLRYRAPGA